MITERKEVLARSLSKICYARSHRKLLPFVAFLAKIQGRKVHFMINNIAVVFGWSSGFMKEDETAWRS